MNTPLGSVQEPEQQQALLGMARTVIQRRLEGAPSPSFAELDHQFAAPGASFVTLTQTGQLRGCMGSLEAHRPLADDIRHNALAAAFHDPRFDALTASELDKVDLSLSILTPPEPMTFKDEPDLLAQLRPDVDGVVLSMGRHRATFLPQVWQQLPEPKSFLGQLKMKAGLAIDFWNPQLEVQRYQVIKFAEAESAL